MTKKDIKLLMELAEKTRKTPCTKEEALERLVRAGILKKNGEFTKHYPALAAFAKKQNVSREA